MNGTVVLFGGFDFNDTMLDETWTWDGASWTQVSGSGPSARAYATAATLNGKIVLFGGFSVFGDYGDLSSPLGDTWTWDGASWTQVDIAGPPRAAVPR